MKRRDNMKTACCVATSVALAFSLAMTPGGVARADVTGGVPEWAVDDGVGGDAAKPSALPSSFDMRDKGWVTPVKMQNPWMTCWAFGASAAAETSILSDANLTYDETKLDLSERHLAWFAVHHITEAEDPAQVGEGGYPLVDGNKAFDTGGNSILVTTVFSQGAGPVTELEYPYRGVDENDVSHTVRPNYPYEKFVEDPDQGTLAVLAEWNNSSVDELRALLEIEAEKYGVTFQQELEMYKADVLYMYKSTEYSKSDDWSIPVTDSNGAPNRFKHMGLTIKDGNVLPTYWDGGTVPNTESVRAIKQEMSNGRGVYIGYRADMAQPGAVADSTYMNKENWAQYTFERVGMDHAVCLVGWDDNYPASNFTHTVYLRDESGELIKDANGNPIADPDSEAKTTPPGNGAWIVKNSWGSETDVTEDDLGNPTGGGTYGIRNSEGKATGYFYLSYYDMTITNPETMSFSSSLLGPTGAISVFQHDYMAASGGFYIETSDDVMSSANVFDLKEEDGDQVVVSVGGRTLDQNQCVTLAIYELDEGATNPTDGKLLYRSSNSFEYAGYHRLDLTQPLAIRSGHKYSIVSTVYSIEDGKRVYGVAANQGVSKKFREWQHTLKDFKDSNLVWSRAVVNRGESFMYKDGAWVDWSDYVTGIAVPDDEDVKAATKAGVKFDNCIDAFPIDNFSLKMYAEPATITLTHQEAAAPTCTEPGNIEYWYYDEAEASGTLEPVRRYFADAAGTKEIGRQETVIAALGHKWGAWKRLDDRRHQRTCEHDSSHVETAAHTWDAGRLVNGVLTYTCSGCGATTMESAAVRYSYSWNGNSGGGSRSDAATGDTSGSGTASTRLAGADRYATMCAIVDEAFTSSTHAVVASGESFTDALVASALAGALDCPTVLTTGASLSPEAASELTRLGVRDVYLVGGDAALSPVVKASIEGMGISVERVAGKDRYATSVEALKVVRSLSRASDALVVATGSNFADALSAGPWAYATKSPLVLARPDGTCGQAAKEAVTQDGGFRRAILVGGTAVVSEEAATELGLAPTRLAGQDRYATSAAIARFAASEGLGFARPAIATGRNFPDALAGAALCGKTRSVLLLADSATDPTVTLVRDHASEVSRVWVLGGTNSVSDELVRALS